MDNLFSHILFSHKQGPKGDVGGPGFPGPKVSRTAMFLELHEQMN